MEASGDCFSAGNAAFVTRTTDKRFEAMVSCHSPSEMASEFGKTNFAAAALLTRMSSPPNALMDSSTSFLQPSGVRMSPLMKVVDESIKALGGHDILVNN